MKTSATHLYRRLTILAVTAALVATAAPGALRSYSDERLKDEIEPVHDAISPEGGRT